jgi:VTT domain
VLAFLAAVLLLPHSPSALRDLVLAAGVAAPLPALAAWIVLTPAVFPGTVLAAARGLAFGAVWGTALAWGGAVLGGLAAFTLGRTLARRPALRLMRRSARLAGLHAMLERRGFGAVLAARLMPGVPASGLCYAAGGLSRAPPRVHGCDRHRRAPAHHALRPARPGAGVGSGPHDHRRRRLGRDRRCRGSAASEAAAGTLPHNLKRRAPRTL